jgi:hypothetical protein
MRANHSPTGAGCTSGYPGRPVAGRSGPGRADARTCPLTAHAACARTSRWARRRPAYRQRAVGSRCAARFSDSSGSPRSAARIACCRRASPNTRRCRRHSGRQASVAWTCSRTTARSLLVGGPVGLGRLWMGHVKHATCCCAGGETRVSTPKRCAATSCHPRSRLIRPWTSWLAAPTPVCYMGEGLSVWTGRDPKEDTGRHAGCGRVHRASVIRPVGAPRLDRSNPSGLRQSEMISPGDDQRVPPGSPACGNVSLGWLCPRTAHGSIRTSRFRILCG